MIKEDKELLLKDLCARLPYGVIVQIPEIFSSELIDVKLDSIVKMKDGLFHFTDDFGYCIEHIKPYLRPMSSMTFEEVDSFHEAVLTHANYGPDLQCELSIEDLDWLNAHHFDYRGLIEKGLAIEVTEENNPYKY